MYNRNLKTVFIHAGRECLCCELNEARKTWKAYDAKDMIGHLQIHIDTGHRVPGFFMTAARNASEASSDQF